MKVVQQFQVSGVTKPLWAASCPGQEVLSKANRTTLTPVLGPHQQWSTQGQAHSWVLGVGTQEEFDQPSLPGSSQDTRVVRGAGTEGSTGAVEPGRFASPWGPWGLGCVGPVCHSTSRTLGVAWDAVDAQ